MAYWAGRRPSAGSAPGLAVALVLALGSAFAQDPPPAPPPTPPTAPPGAPAGQPAATPRPQRRQRPPRPEVRNVEEFRLRSACLSEFWGRDMFLEAGVVRPLDAAAGERLPVSYNIHGFGGSHENAWYQGPRLQEEIKSGAAPRMLYVFLKAQCPRGHHEFADSANNGPCGRALTTELIPALEEKFGAVGEPAARFVTGHSSGGWASLWLQVAYPDFFGGCWATAPDSVDFRDFTGIDIYSFENAYVDPEGADIMLVREKGKFVASIKQYAARERDDIGGQFYSFNAVFSPRADDGTPMQLFDFATGAIDARVADTWRKYDIGLLLRENWAALGPRLAGKIHVYMGLLDTFRLEGATQLLQEDLAGLGSDAEILLVEGRDHGTLFDRHPELWPKGMMERIHREMFARWQQAAASGGAGGR